MKSILKRATMGEALTLSGRTGFVGDLIYSMGVSSFIYPIFGHWGKDSASSGLTASMRSHEGVAIDPA